MAAPLKQSRNSSSHDSSPDWTLKDTTFICTALYTYMESCKRFPYGSIHTFVGPSALVKKKKKKIDCSQITASKKRLWKCSEIYNIISGESAEIVKFIQSCHVHAKLLSVSHVRRKGKADFT